ncbi:MAG: DUF4349 domain-containing protein [Pirellulales bacterium]|nr:DUF4349 domain-containing protein [Pirellulales bacterium]
MVRLQLVCVLVLCAVGCGMQAREAGHHSPDMPAASELAAVPAAAEADMDADLGPSGSASLKRKIIYTASLDLVVEQFDPVPEEVQALAEQYDGYIARSNIAGSPGNPRTGHWTIRVPVARFDSFLQAARRMGEVRSENTDSNDVSEEYYDLESRIRNKQKQEERLLELLADATGKLPDVLAVERELARVREEIERWQGRVRVLDDLTDLTTVDVTVQEVRDYVPEKAAGYSTRLRRALGKSVDSLKVTAEHVSIGAVAALPWLGVLLVPVLVVVGVWRLRRRRASH